MLAICVSAAPARAAAPVVAQLTIVGEGVEHSSGDERWLVVPRQAPLRVGDRVRTGPGIARIDYPWMSMLAGPGSIVAVPRRQILSTVLEQGRTEQTASAGGFIKLETPEAQVRGTGHIVVRREGTRTTVMVWSGESRVQSAQGSVDLGVGEGTVVAEGIAPTPAAPLPQAPATLRPFRDPLYVMAGTPVTLAWEPSGTGQRIEVLALDTDEVVMQADVGGSPASLLVPWLGTYRWRVSVRDAAGLESRPSVEGLFCVVEK